jgi:hypothetical protein
MLLRNQYSADHMTREHCNTNKITRFRGLFFTSWQSFSCCKEFTDFMESSLLSSCSSLAIKMRQLNPVHILAPRYSNGVLISDINTVMRNMCSSLSSQEFQRQRDAEFVNIPSINHSAIRAGPSVRNSCLERNKCYQGH